MAPSRSIQPLTFRAAPLRPRRWRPPSTTAIGSGMPVTSSSGAAPSTSMPRRSGAASRSARSTVSSSVDCEAPQPSQLPCSRSRATPSSIPSSSMLPPWDSM